MRFGKQELDTLRLEGEDEQFEKFFNINNSNKIYEFLKANVACPDFFSFVINELYENRDKIPGLFASDFDEENMFMTSAKDTFINLVCIDGDKREQIITNVMNTINAKKRKS